MYYVHVVMYKLTPNLVRNILRFRLHFNDFDIFFYNFTNSVPVCLSGRAKILYAGYHITRSISLMLIL